VKVAFSSKQLFWFCATIQEGDTASGTDHKLWSLIVRVKAMPELKTWKAFWNWFHFLVQWHSYMKTTWHALAARWILIQPFLTSFWSRRTQRVQLIKNKRSLFIEKNQSPGEEDICPQGECWLGLELSLLILGKTGFLLAKCLMYNKHISFCIFYFNVRNFLRPTARMVSICVCVLSTWHRAGHE
jgi:hypothetical protein